MKRSLVLALAALAAPTAVPAEAALAPCFVHVEAVESWTNP
jgi:hypothetical protein